MDDTLLKYDSVEISFGGNPVVHDISFSLRPGEILGLVGESGSGKSTLIKAAMGLLGDNGLVTRGDIIFKGENLVDMPERELRLIRGAGIGMIFQDAGASLCPIRTIGSQICESMGAHGKITEADAKARALELLSKLNFKEPERIWDSYPFEMSGGMNQRAGIAISMLMNPPVLFADEPTSALDVTVQKQVAEELLFMRKTYNTAMILVTHNIGVVRMMADRILVLQNGQAREYGETEAVLDHPKDPYTKKLMSSVLHLKRAENQEVR